MVLALALSAAACSNGGRGGFGTPTTTSPPPTTGSPATPPSPVERRQVVVATPGLRFDPVELEVGAGEHLLVVLDNTDAEPHTLTVNEFNLSIRAEAGEQVRLPVAVETPGTFQMYCAIPGHLAAGMEGTITVS